MFLQHLIFLVLILPMRNGNYTSVNPYGVTLYVLILPMRNGNFNNSSISCNFFSSSYPTYEEWKLRKSISCSKKELVLILPMRNGNLHFQLLVTHFCQAKFLSYLWGMETWDANQRAYVGGHSSYPTYEEWKLLYVRLISHIKFRFLSYLWGMETLFCDW